MRDLVRPVTLAAALLIVGGLYVLLWGVPYTTQSQVMRIGDFEATVEERHTIPPWIGVVAILGGLVLLGSRVATWSRTSEPPERGRVGLRSHDHEAPPT